MSLLTPSFDLAGTRSVASTATSKHCSKPLFARSFTMYLTQYEALARARSAQRARAGRGLEDRRSSLRIALEARIARTQSNVR